LEFAIPRRDPMGLPQLDFRVPEATWFKSALAGRFGKMPLAGKFATMPGLGSTGALAWPYKIAAVAVMALVACGTLVTFGSAQAETPSSAELAALPGTDEANPSVEGQVLPPTSQGLLNANDLLSSLNLTDYTPGDDDLSLFDDDDGEDSEDSDEDNDDSESTKSTPTPKASSSSTAGNSDDGDSDDGGSDDGGSTPTPEPEPEPVEGDRHQRWENCMSSGLNRSLGICGSEPDFED
jgi:hypothetical protein